IDQPWHERTAADVDDLCAVSLQRARRHLADEATLYEDLHPFRAVGAFPVEHPRISQHDRRHEISPLSRGTMPGIISACNVERSRRRHIHVYAPTIAAGAFGKPPLFRISVAERCRASMRMTHAHW